VNQTHRKWSQAGLAGAQRIHQRPLPKETEPTSDGVVSRPRHPKWSKATPADIECQTGVLLTSCKSLVVPSFFVTEPCTGPGGNTLAPQPGKSGGRGAIAGLLLKFAIVLIDQFVSENADFAYECQRRQPFWRLLGIAVCLMLALILLTSFSD
jgi:hypothetical protein